MQVVHLPINPKLKELISCIIFTASVDRFAIGSYVCLHPATPQTGLCFHFDDGISMRKYGDAGFVKQPVSVIVGQQLSPVLIETGAKFRSLRIGFQPGGLQSLLGISLDEITDTSLDATDIWGSDMSRLSLRLQETASATDISHLINQFFLKKYCPLKSVKNCDYAIRFLISNHGDVSVSEVSTMANMSMRQFERRCIERTGVTVKTLSRIARFSKAYRLKERFAEMSWTKIAHECGYYDQSHFIKDFTRFAGVTPGKIERQLQQAPLKLQCHLRF